MTSPGASLQKQSRTDLKANKSSVCSPPQLDHVNGVLHPTLPPPPLPPLAPVLEKSASPPSVHRRDGIFYSIKNRAMPTLWGSSSAASPMITTGRACPRLPLNPRRELHLYICTTYSL